MDIGSDIIQDICNSVRTTYAETKSSFEQSLMTAKLERVNIDTIVKKLYTAIEPVKNEIDIISAYDALIEDVDTLTVRSYDLEGFTESFTDFDYKIHRMTVVSEKNDVFDKLNEPIISSLTKNKYFAYLKKLTNENI